MTTSLEVGCAEAWVSSSSWPDSCCSSSPVCVSQMHACLSHPETFIDDESSIFFTCCYVNRSSILNLRSSKNCLPIKNQPSFVGKLSLAAAGPFFPRFPTLFGHCSTLCKQCSRIYTPAASDTFCIAKFLWHLRIRELHPTYSAQQSVHVSASSREEMEHFYIVLGGRSAACYCIIPILTI